MPLTRPRTPAGSGWQQIVERDVERANDGHQLVVGHGTGPSFDLGYLGASERYTIRSCAAAQILLRNTRPHGTTDFTQPGADQITRRRR